MSKTYNKVVNAIHALLQAVPVTAESFQLDVAAFRSANKLGSEPKALLVKHINEALIRDDANESDDGLGAWVMGEVKHPVYQFSRLNAVSEIRYTENRPHFVTVGTDNCAGRTATEQIAAVQLPKLSQSVSPEAWVEEMLSLRSQARRADDRDLHEEITQTLVAHNVIVTDCPDGTTWTGEPREPEGFGAWSASAEKVAVAKAKSYKEEQKAAKARLAADKKLVKEQMRWLSAVDLSIAQKHKLLGRSPAGAAALSKTDLRAEIKRIKDAEKAAKNAKVKQGTETGPKKGRGSKQITALQKGAKAYSKKNAAKPSKPESIPMDSSIPPGASVAQHYGIGN